MKKRSLAISIIALFVVVMALFTFVACDEEENSNVVSNEASMSFDKNTTLVDVVNMIDAKKIESYTLKSVQGEGNACVTFTYYVTPQYWLYEYTSQESKGLSGFIFENDGIYLVNYEQGHSAGAARYATMTEDMIETYDTTNYYLGKYDEQGEGINKNVKVNGKVISWTRYQVYEYGEDEKISFTLYNVNATTMTLPNELKNYKEIATEE